MLGLLESQFLSSIMLNQDHAYRSTSVLLYTRMSKVLTNYDLKA